MSEPLAVASLIGGGAVVGSVVLGGLAWKSTKMFQAQVDLAKTCIENGLGEKFEDEIDELLNAKMEVDSDE